MIPLLTPAEARALGLDTAVEDTELAGLIAGVSTQIDLLAGPLEEYTEVRRGDSAVLFLARPTAAVVRIREYGETTDLATDDYRLDSDHRTIWRLNDGTNPRARWRGPVTVDCVPMDDLSVRRLVAMKMLQLELTGMPGVLGFTEGNWSIQFKNGESWATTRADVMSPVGLPWHFG